MILWKFVCLVLVFDFTKSLSEDGFFDEDDLTDLFDIISKWKRLIHRFPEALWMLNSFPHIRFKNWNGDDFFPTDNDGEEPFSSTDDRYNSVSTTSRYSTDATKEDFSANNITTEKSSDKFYNTDRTSNGPDSNDGIRNTSSYPTDGKMSEDNYFTGSTEEGDNYFNGSTVEGSPIDNNTVTSVGSTELWNENDTDALAIAILELLSNETGILEEIYNFLSRRSTKCNDHLWYAVHTKIDRHMIIEMLDAAGKLPAGLRRGNIRWLGDYRQCQNITVPSRFPFEGFKGQYCYVSCKVSLGSKAESVPLSTGICVPDSCSAEDLKTDYSDIKHFLSKMPLVNKINTSLELTDVTCQANDREWSGGDIAYIVILVLFAILITAGTVLDLRNNKQEKDVTSQKRSSRLNTNESVPDVVVPNETTTIAIGKERTYGDEVPLSIQSGPTNETNKLSGEIFSFLLCFSVYSNASKILTVGNQHGQISCLHGIRFLSLSWVIFGHVFVYAMTSVGNIADALEDINSFSFQVASQATFAVDSFFLLSGLLLSFLYFKECEKRHGKMNWIYYYVHRIWRLTPAFAMLLGFYTTLWLHTGSGPLWPAETDNGNCQKSWWWNLLYIVNFHDVNHNCMGWTWYLANDMQFYIISPIFLILLWKLPVVGLVAVSLVTVASWVLTGVLSAINDFRLFTSATENLQLSDVTKVEESQWHYFNTIYDKPYCRIGPYLIGLLLGYALYRTSGRQKILKTWLLIVGWITAVAVGVSVVFGIYHVAIGRITAAFYNALARSAWSMALGWVILVCVTGQAGPVNKLLSWNFWIPLSRLTYCAYLIHPMIMTWYYSSLQTLLHFQMNTMVLFYFGYLVFAYLLAFIASVAFESPMMALEKFVLKRLSR